ncbi:MAG: diguanylate cyclase [Bryobacteraceae bacterium]
MSLFKHVAELDRFETAQKATLASYAAALESLAAHAVEVDPGTTEKHRARLRAFQVHALEAGGSEALQEIQPLLESELRDYHDSCELHIAALRQDMTTALVSLQEVMTSFCTSGQGQEASLRNELVTLETLAAAEDGDALRRGVQSAVVTIAECVEQIRRQNEMVVAQFRDEIRIMQARLEEAEASAAIDTTTGALKRDALEARIRRVIHLDEPVCLVIVKIANYRELRGRHGEFLTGEALAGFCNRIREEFGKDVDLGRWSDDAFMFILKSTKHDALKRTRDLGKRAASPFVCLEEGRKHTIQLKTKTGLAEFEPAYDSRLFLTKAEGLCQALI